MKWTNEKPTEAGYYWWRTGDQGKERPMIFFINFEGRIYSSGRQPDQFLKNVIDKGEWWGPIEEPPKD